MIEERIEQGLGSKSEKMEVEEVGLFKDTI